MARAGLAGRISFELGDARQLPFRDGAFDWAWSVDCVGYAPIEPLRMVSELARVVRPGGTVAILAWSSQMLLPGYPVLEARLNATAAGIGPFRVGDRPETHFTRALGLLRQAGLVDLRVETLAAGVHAPLSGRQRRAWTALLEMRWAGAEAELSPEDAAEVRRLCLPGSPDYIVDHPDYYGFFTYSMFMGRWPGYVNRRGRRGGDGGTQRGPGVRVHRFHRLRRWVRF